VPRRIRRPGALHVLLGREEMRHLRGENLARLAWLEVAMISAVPNMPIATTTKPMPSEAPEVEGEAQHPGIDVRCPRWSSRPKDHHGDGLDERAMREHRRGTRPSTIREKYSAGPELQATSASGGAATAMIMVATHPAKNEPIAAIRERRARAPWAPSGSRRGR